MPPMGAVFPFQSCATGLTLHVLTFIDPLGSERMWIMMRRTLAALTILAGVCVAAAAPPSYQVHYLGDGWTGMGINSQGDVCGNVSPDGTALRAGVSHGGQPFQLLPLPPGMQSSRVHDINDEGVIVGAVCSNQYVITQPTAAVWRPNQNGYDVEVLGGLPSDPYSAAFAINNLGDIIGASGFWGWNLSTGVLFTSAGPVALTDGILGADINDQHIVLSGARLLDLNSNVITTIPMPPGNWQGFVGAALNNNNDFGGYILGYSSCSAYPVRYRQSVGWEFLGGCAQTAASVTAMNDRGDALSYYYIAAAGVHFVDEGYFMLGSLIDPSQGAWFVQWSGANAINDSRQIVASARQGLNGPIGAVLLTPIPVIGDVSGDGIVNVQDLLAVINAWGACPAPPQSCRADVAPDPNGDGVVNVQDLLFVIAHWG